MKIKLYSIPTNFNCRVTNCFCTNLLIFEIIKDKFSITIIWSLFLSYFNKHRGMLSYITYINKIFFENNILNINI